MKIYRPTVLDKQRIKPIPNMLKVSGDQVFATFQGEGITAGQPAVFLRLHYCNLACSWCDTKYTWDKTRKEFWQEPIDWSYPEAVTKIKAAWLQKFGLKTPDSKKRLVITGGEPLLQQAKIVKLLQFLPNWRVEIETNGTIIPLAELSNCQINCSPKLENSGNLLSLRFKSEVLKQINSLPNSWFKFVVVKAKDLEEIDEIVTCCALNPEKILIMPEGYTVETISEHLIQVKTEVQKRKWRVIQRNQIIWYGNKRRT